MQQKPIHTPITKAQIYRAVASSTAIETGASVKEVEQQMERARMKANAVGLGR